MLRGIKLSVYPTGLTNYFHPDPIADSSTRTSLLTGPLALKSITCGATLSSGDQDDGGFIYKLFDGSTEIYRIFDCISSGSEFLYSSANSRFNIFFPLAGLRVNSSLEISIESVGTMTNLKAVGISVLYRR